MNDTFSFKRLLLLIKKHWHENRKLHWLGLLASTGVLVAFYLFVIVTHSYRVLDIESQAMYFFISLTLVFIIYSLVFFNVLNKKEKATAYLLIPASHAEKLLCGIFYCTIVLSFVWFGIFCLVNTSMVDLFNKIAAANMEKYRDMFADKKFIPRETDNLFVFKEMYFNALSICYSLQAGALLGSFYFERYTLVKTIATTIAVWLLLVVIQSVVLQGIIPTNFYLFEMGVYKTNNYSMDSQGRDIYTPSKYIFLSDSLKNVSSLLLRYSIWPLLTLATYFRLQEKEI
jgi:hypothetical protein